jgi:hypothetical protein
MKGHFLWSEWFDKSAVASRTKEFRLGVEQVLEILRAVLVVLDIGREFFLDTHHLPGTSFLHSKIED